MDIPFSEFHSPDGNTPAESSFYFLKRNGLTTLRSSSEAVSKLYTNYYKDRTEVFFKFFLATMIIGIVFLLITILIMLPKTFSVNKTNMKVLSLFGYILPEEVKKLADKCEQYMEEHLDEVDLQKEYSSYFFSQEEGEEELQQLTVPAENYNEPLAKRHLSSVEEYHNESATSGHQDFTLQMKEFSEIHEDQRKLPVLSARSSLHTPGRHDIMTTTNRTTARDDKPLITKIDMNSPTQNEERGKNKNQENGDKEEEEEDEEVQEYLHERSKKLLNSPDHSKKGAMVRMSAFASIFMAFFVLDFIMEAIFLKNYRNIVTHLQLIATRTADLKFVQMFTQEEIYDNDLTVTYPTCISFPNIKK